MRTANHDEPQQSNGDDANIDPMGCDANKMNANIVVVQLTKPTSSAPVGVDLASSGDAKAVRGLALACGLSTAPRRALQPGDLLLSVSSVNEVKVADPVVSADALTRGDERIRPAPDQHLVRVYSADQLVLRFRRPPVSDSPR